MAKLGDHLHLPQNSECLQKLTENYVVSNQKIVAAMGKPLPVAAREGYANAIESLEVGSKLMSFSTLPLNRISEDDVRFESDMWSVC